MMVMCLAEPSHLSCGHDCNFANHEVRAATTTTITNTSSPKLILPSVFARLTRYGPSGRASKHARPSLVLLPRHRSVWG